jgi:hypothetical protein
MLFVYAPASTFPPRSLLPLTLHFIGIAHSLLAEH